MPDNDQFKIIIDDSALDKTIEKAKKTSAELTAQFNKASENLRAAFGKAFAPDQLQSFVDQVKTKVSALQGSVSIKAPIEIDISKISTATGTVKSLRSEVALLQSTASAAADALQGHFGGVLQGIIQHLKNLQMERKIIEDDLAASASKGYKPLPGGGVSGIRLDSLKGEEREAQAALNLLTNVLGKINGVQNALDQAVRKVQNTPSIASAVRRVTSSSGSRTPLPKDEISKDLREYVTWHQEQTNNLRDALDAQLDNMEHAVAGRRRALPDIKPGMARKQALEILKDQKELDALYKEIAAMRRDPKASQDILGALSGPDLSKMYDRFARGDASVEELNTKILGQIEKARTKMRGLSSKYMRVMEEFPEHIRTSGGEIIIPGLPGQAAVPTSQVFASPTAIQGIETQIAQLKKLGDQSVYTQNRIKELQNQLEFYKTKAVTEVAPTRAGVKTDVALPKKYYTGEDYHPEGMPGEPGSVESIEEFHQKITGLNVAYSASAQSAETFKEEVASTGAIVKQAAEQHKPLLSMFGTFDSLAGRAKQLFGGVKQDASEMPSVIEKIKQINAIVREPVMLAGPESFDFAERLKGSIGNATGYVRRELSDTTFRAQESLFKFGEVIKVMGEEVTLPFKKIIDQIVGVKDAAGKLQGIGPQFKLGDQTVAGDKVSYLKAFEERIARIQGLLLTLDTAPATTLPKLEKEILSMSTSLGGVGEHYKKVNEQASEMSGAFRVQPLINDLRTLFTSPNLASNQLVEAQVKVGELNTKFGQMVKYAPELEPLRKQFQNLSSEFLKSKAFKIEADPKGVEQLELQAAKTLKVIQRLHSEKPEGYKRIESPSGAMLPDGSFPAPAEGEEIFNAAQLKQFRAWEKNVQHFQKKYDDQRAAITKARAITPASQEEVKASYDQFAAGIAPFAKQLNFTQVISDALMQLARLARGAGDVGRNSSMMSDQLIKMIELLHTSSTKGLTSAEGDALRKIVTEMDRYTVKLNSDHLPAVRKLNSEYRSFNDTIDKTVGKMLKTTERGALPEKIQEHFAPPKLEKPMPLEEWIETLSKGARIPKAVGDKFNREYIELFFPPGHAQGKQLTTADMFGTGRFELIDQITAKTQSYGRALDFVDVQLQKPNEFVNFYQPQMKSAEGLKLYVQRLREAISTSADFSPHVASMALSLDTAQTSLSHTTSSFNFLKNAIAALHESGGTVTPQWLGETQKGLEKITQAHTTGTPTPQKIIEGGPWTFDTSSVEENVRKYQDRLKGVLSGSSMRSNPSAIYSAIKEAMKLPSSIGKEPIISKGIGELLFGGEDQSLMKNIPYDRIMQIKGALGEYFKEIEESGFGERSVTRARLTVGKLFNEINKEIIVRKQQAYNDKTVLPSVDSSAMPSRWEQETPKLAKHMKGAFKAVFEGIEDSDVEKFPGMERMIKKTSNWSIKQIDDLIVTLKRKMAQVNRELAKAASPDELGISASEEKQLLKNINWGRTVDTLEKQKQAAIFEQRKLDAKTTGIPLITPTGSPEALASVAANEDVVLVGDSVKAATGKVVGSIDSLTKEKVAALKRQITQMKGVDVGSALKETESKVTESLGEIEARISGGKESTSSRNLSNLINPFVLLNDQIETFGHAVGKQGQPLAMWGELAKAARQQVFDLLREVSKTGISTNYLDEQVAKFNATASDDKKVRTFTELQDHIQTLKQSLATAMPEYMAALNSGEDAAALTKRKELVNVIGMLNKAFIELESTVAATLSTEALANDLHAREITTIRELGQAYRMAKLEASVSMGPFASGSREKLGETAFAGREIASQSLITSAWNTTGAAPGGMFAGIGAPAATVDDLFVKLLSQPGQITQLGAGLRSNVEAFRELNNAFGLGIAEPKGLDNIVTRFDQVRKAVGAGKSISPSFVFGLKLNEVQDYFKQILTSLNTATQSSTESQFSINLVKGIQKSRDEARSLINEIELLIKTADRASSRQGTLGAQQTRIRLFETIKQKQEQLGQTGLALELDKEAPSELKGAVTDVGIRLAGASKNVLSIWERLTNTVKTTRNNFADLFMYQVRWYTSMMLFWGVLNKVGETFKGLISTQHEIQRAVRAMRDESGELITHWQRLESIATIHIFDSMIKWATDAKLAGEALWQLGSAGLTASESIAALGPVVGLIRATEGDPQETTKIVAGVYNTLQDAIEGNIAASTKFRIITDVMSKTFRDHQVELSELNQGYRYAITSADMAGLSFYELSSILGVLNDNMIKGSRAGRGLQQVLTHIAKEPYAIAASFIELGKHMEVPATAMAKLTGGDLKKMSTMDMLREFSKIAMASGKSLEGLGRIMESFDMIGGRTLAPLLLNFDKVDKSTRDLLLHSAGATESMAARMSTTIQANMRRIASYFQAAVYPMITGVHHGLTAIMNFVGGTALALQGLQSKIITGGFKFVGMEGAGTFLDTGLKAATMLGTLALISGQLPGKFNVVSTALKWMSGVAETSFTRLGVLFINLASAGPAIVSFFSSIRTHLTSAGTAAKSFTAAMVTSEFWVGWGSAVTSACSTAKVAVIAFFAEWWKMGILKGMMFGLKESILGIGQAFGFVATLFSRHPIMMAITAISLAVGGMAYYFRVWKQSYDDMVTAATEADAKYQEKLGKIEQKAVAAAHAQAETESSKAAWDSLTAGMEGATKATEEQKAAYDSYTNSLGINDHTTRINSVSVGRLRERLEELSPVIERNSSAIRGHRNALANDKELIDAYIESIKKQRDVIKAAEEKKQRVDTAEEDPRENWFKRDFLNRAWNIVEPGYAQKERQRRQQLYEEMQNEAFDDLSAAQKSLADKVGSRVSSQTQGPLQVFIKSLTETGKNRREISKIFTDALTAPDKDLRDWVPVLPESIDNKKMPQINWTQIMRDAMPAQADDVIKNLVKEKMSLRFLVGEGFAKEIEKLDLSKAADMITAKKLLLFGQLQAHSSQIINIAMDSMKISIGDENARKKAQDATDKANEALLKSQSNFYKKWTDMRMTYEEARLASMEKGYTADIFATKAFMLESNQLDAEYIATQEEFKLKRKEIEREHPEIGRDQYKVKLDQVSVDEKIALMEIDKKRLELIKRVGEATQKAWQEGAGENLKYEASMKNVRARTLEAEAAEKIAKIERDIASGVRASAQEVQEAHELKMAAYKAELEAKKLELQYNLTGEKLKLDAEINALKDPEKLKAMSPDQRKYAQDRVSILERQRSHAESLFQANMEATNAEARRKASEEARREQKQHLDVLVQNVKVALGEIESAQAQVRTTITGGSLGIGINAPIRGTLTSTFNDSRGSRLHHGGDIGAPAGTPFYAPTDLDIRNTRDLMSDGKTGGMVWGVDAQGVWHKFHHVQPGVQAGQHVKVGEQLGVLSNIKGPHLDYKMQDAQGNYIDWMSSAGLTKGSKIGGRITGQVPLTTQVMVGKAAGESGESTPQVLADTLQRLFAFIDKTIATEGPNAKKKFRPVVTEMMNGLKDMQIEPDQIAAFQSVFNALEGLWQQLGMKMKKFYPLILDSYKKMFDKGETFEIPVLVKYSDAARKAGETEEQIRKRIFEVDKIAFENEANWTAGKFGDLMKFIDEGAKATGISGKKLNTYLFAEVFSPSKLQTMLDSDIELMDMFYQQLSQLSRNLTGGIPTKVMKSFESAIKSIISSGEELDIKKYTALVNTLAQIPKINLKEAADSIEKYWQAIANTRSFNVQDLGKMQNDMMRFGSTQDEVWKAIGEVAEVQIRRIYADWNSGAKGMKGDMSDLKDVGEAFWWGMTKGVADFASKLKDPIRRLADEVTQILTNVQSTLESVIEDSLKGEFKGWSEYSKKFGESLIKIASKNLSEMMMQSVSGLIGKALGIPEPKKPGTLTQAEAEGAGKASAEQQARFNTEGILKETKRSADGIEKLVAIGEKKETEQAQKAVRGEEVGTETSAKGGVGTKGGVSEAPAGTFSPTISETTAQKKAFAIPAKSEKTGEAEKYTTEDYLNPDKGPEMYESWKKTFGPSADAINAESKTSEPATESSGAADQIGGFDWGLLNPLQVLTDLIPFQFAKGGVVPGSGNTDSVPAMLTPGEIVLSRAMVRRFAEGGDVENPLQGLMSGIGDMVSGMMAPFAKMMNPRAQQIAQIGEGNYGGTFEAQGAWDDQFEQVRNMYRQQDAQKYAQYQQQQLQQMMQGGFFSSMLGGLFGGGKAEGGLIQKLNLGGLVQFLATGGPILQKDINPSLYNAHVTSSGQLYSNWPDIQKAKPTPWYKKALTWLPLLPLLMGMGSLLGGDKGKGTEADALKKQLDAIKTPDLEGKGLEQAYKESLSGLPDKGMFEGLFPGKNDMFGIPTQQFKGLGKDFKNMGWLGDAGGKLDLDTGQFTSLFKPDGFAEGGVIQTRSDSERPWQNAGHTETVYEGPKQTFWNSIKPYLLMALPALMALAKKKKSSTGDSSPEMELLNKKMSTLKGPDLEPKSLDSSYKDFLKGGSDKDAIGSEWSKYLEKGKASDWLSDAKLDKSAFDISDLKSSLASTTATAPESGGFLSNLFGGSSSGGGFLSGLSDLGGSLWGGLKGIGSGLLSLFGFADGGMVGGLLSTGGSLIGSIFGPIGSMVGGFLGNIFGGLFGGLFGGKKKEESAPLDAGGGSFSGLLGGLGDAGTRLWGAGKGMASSEGGGSSSLFGGLGETLSGLGGGLFGGLGSLGSGLLGGLSGLGGGILGVGKSLFSGIGSLFGFAEGGFVDSILNMLGPSQAQAMELSDVIPQISKSWDATIAAGGDAAAVATQAKGGIEDVVSFFQKNNPGVMADVSKIVGTSSKFSGESEGVFRDPIHGGYYNPDTDNIVLDLKDSYADLGRVRGDYASALTHEVAHDLSKTGRPLAGWLQQVDPSKVSAFLKQQGITDVKELEYLSSAHETVARGVAHHAMQQMNVPGYDGNVTWPKEYDPMMQELAKGMATGKYPQAPDQGFLKNLLWKVYGKPAGFAVGGTIPGTGDGDTVPAMLTPGEFVINKRTVGMFGPQFFHALQDLAKTRGAASPEVVLSGTRPALQFATGGVVPRLPKVSSAPTENKITVATVMDEESVGQFLNTKKYGEVLVNKLGSGITRRMQGGQGI